MDIVRTQIRHYYGATRQHMQTFGTIENIYREKQELVSGLPQDGFLWCIQRGEQLIPNSCITKCKPENAL